MRSVNRAAVVVRPKQPFFDWARSLEGGLPASTQPWTSVYLVPLGEDDTSNDIVRRHFGPIFEEQLASWHRNANAWPTSRTFSLFRQWFDVAVVALVFDLAGDPIEHDG